MNKEFVPYEEALALKELGFKEQCFGWYCMNKKQLYPISPLGKNFDDTALAPLYQQAFRFLEEKSEFIVHSIGKCDDGLWASSYWNGSSDIETADRVSYEEAELACLRKLIEILNQNKEDE